MPDDDFEATLERLRAEYEFIGPDGDLERRLHIVENAAREAQDHGHAIPNGQYIRVTLRRREI